MDSAKQQLVEKLKAANNVLVTVSRNPSVDQLSSLIGLSLLINKQGKHCAAVFSGSVPSTIEFLKPEDTIEKNTDSLRDFIIALDKSKADKLRYKVENNIVRIFITPYRTSITQADLEFSQGDFNVDLVIALGVRDQADLDEAITAHGRILHDATVASINVANASQLGSINWQNQGASSLSELVTALAQSLGDNLLDVQIATALLTGIVSETQRFSNEKTSSQTMQESAVLMAAGANQQLVATQLEQTHDSQSNNSGENETKPEQSDNKDDQPKPANNDGTLEIEHNPEDVPAENKSSDVSDQQPPAGPSENDNNTSQLLGAQPEAQEPQNDNQPEQANLGGDMPPAGLPSRSKLVTEPPSLGGTLTANSQLSELDPVTDPLSLPQVEDNKILDRTQTPPPTAQITNDFSLPEPPDLSGALDEPDQAPIAPPSSAPAPENDFSQPPLPAPSENAGPTSSPWSNITAPAVDDTPDPVGSSLPAVPPVAPTPPAAEDNENDLAQLHIDENGTLSQIEESVHSPHLNQNQPPVPEIEPGLPNSGETLPDADAARAEIDAAISAAPPAVPPPIQALGAQPLGPELHDSGAMPPPPSEGYPGLADASVPSGVPPQPDLGVPLPPPVPPPMTSV
jgi:hypothetical protein